MQLMNVALRRDAGPAPARRRRPHRPPPRAGLLRQRRPRRAARARARWPRGRAGRRCTRRSPTTTRRSTSLGEGWWPRGWSVLDDLVEAIELPDAPLGARRPVAPGGRPALARRALVRGRGGAAPPPRRAGPLRRARPSRRGRLPVPGAVRAPRYIRDVRAPFDRHPRGRLHGARRRPRGAVAPPPAAPQAARRDRRRRLHALRARRVPALARAGRRACARCRCTPTWPRTRCPTTTPRRCSSRVRVEYPVKADKALGLGTTPTLRLQRAFGTPGPLRGLGEAARVVALGLVRVPARHRRLRAAAPPRPVPAAPPRASTRRSTSASSATGRSRPRRRGSPPSTA